jgi:hypothetical protein
MTARVRVGRVEVRLRGARSTASFPAADVSRRVLAAIHGRAGEVRGGATPAAPPPFPARLSAELTDRLARALASARKG